MVTICKNVQFQIFESLYFQLQAIWVQTKISIWFKLLQYLFFPDENLIKKYCALHSIMKCVTKILIINYACEFDKYLNYFLS